MGHTNSFQRKQKPTHDGIELQRAVLAGQIRKLEDERREISGRGAAQRKGKCTKAINELEKQRAALGAQLE